MGKHVETIETGNEAVGIYTANVLPVKLVTRENSENCEPSEPSVFFFLLSAKHFFICLPKLKPQK